VPFGILVVMWTHNVAYSEATMNGSPGEDLAPSSSVYTTKPNMGESLVGRGPTPLEGLS